MGWAEGKTRRRKSNALEGARNSWREFIKKDISQGGGALHAFARRVEEAQRESVPAKLGKAGFPKTSF